MAPVPALYHYWFAWADPLICLQTVLLTFFDPLTMVNATFPTTKLDPHYVGVLDHLGGAFLCLGVLTAVLPRVTNYDLRAWKTLQASILLFDLVILVSVYGSLQRQGHLSPATWRMEDWVSGVLTVWVAVLRTSFVAGVGLGKDGRAGKKRA